MNSVMVLGLVIIVVNIVIALFNSRHPEWATVIGVASGAALFGWGLREKATL